MAKEILDTNIDKPSVATITDYSPEDQPNGNTFVLNGITKTSEGDKKKISTEQSNEDCGNISSGYLPIGKIYTNDGRTVIFSVLLDESNSEIGIIDKNCVYTPKVTSPDLGFKLNHQIQGTYRLRKGCDDVIYYTDGYNSIGNFNFSKPQDYYTEDYLAFINNGSVGTFRGKIWDINKFKLFPAYTIPCFSNVEVVTGGTIVPGTYNFAIRYLDDNLNPTNYIYSSQLIPIFQSNLSGNYNDILGSSNVENDDISGIINTTKSVKITLGRLDTNYKFYQIAVIQAVDGTGLVSKVLTSPTYPIGLTEYIFDGNIEGYTVELAANLTLGKTDIDIAQHIEQIENKLLLANVKGRQIPYCTFQQAASKIVSNYIIREVEDVASSTDGNPKDPNTYWDQQGYMGDEVYAMGIVFVLNDGLETPAFHIPGRSPGMYKKNIGGDNQLTGDQSIISTWTNDLSPWNTDATNYNALPISQKLKRWQVYDTSVAYSPLGLNTSYGAMSYWENKGAVYTNFSDCEGLDFWGEDACGLSLIGKPIRHHKFPSRFKEPHIRGGSIFSGSTGLFYDVSLNPTQTFPDDGLTIIIAYDLNSIPKTYSKIIMASDLPIERFLVDQFEGDFTTIVITSVTGTLLDTGNAAITIHNIYRDSISSSTLNGNIIRNLGIQFSNIIYPHPAIVGHYFVRGPRDNQNRTVLDKGFANNLRQKQVNGINYTGFAYFTGDVNDPTQDNYLFTPRFLFNKESLIGDYLKYENEFIHDQDVVGSYRTAGTGSIFKELDTFIEVRTQAYNGVTTLNGDKNFKVDKSIILDATNKSLTFEDSNQPVYDLSWSNRLHVVHTTSIFPRPNKNMPYVAYKIDQNVHPDLEQIVYQRTHNCMLTPADTNTIFGGDTFINYLNLCNSLYRTQKKGVLTAILSIVLVVGAVVATVATGGLSSPLIAAAISAGAAVGVGSAVVVTALIAGLIGVTANSIESLTNEINGDLGQITNDNALAHATGTGWKLSSYVAYANEFMQSLYVESEVNIGLRQTENHVCGEFYRYESGGIENYFRNRWMYFDQGTNAYQPKGYCCPEVYHYNKDYSRQNLQSVYFPLAENYDCCSDCAESHPDRVHYSEESFQEESTDNYKIFLPNNYRDIESEHGAITNLIKRNNNLFLHTSEAIWALPQNQQQQVTSELITFIGTGEFFSIPPKKIIDDDIGTAGSGHKWATLNTDKGLLFVNEIDSQIILYDEKFNEISKVGNQRWFKENLQDFLARQFQIITGTIFPNTNNPANPYGVGIHTVYDKRYNRILITKRDYLLLPDFTSAFRVVTSINGLMPSGLSDGQLVFDMTTSKFLISKGSPSSYTLITLDNTQYFENRSWTFSYDLDEQSWTSWHSYLPKFYYHIHNDFYSMIDSSNIIWKHNKKGSFLNFYGKQYPHIIEVVLKDNPSETRYWDDISLQTIAKRYDQASDQFYDQGLITFNKLIAYNSRQATGTLNLLTKNEIADLNYLSQAISQTPGEIFITKKEGNWNLNDLRDYRNDYNSPIFTKSWDLLRANYFMDKTLDQTKIDFNKDWIQLEVLRDKFIILRLIFDNFTDVQLSTNYILNTSGESMR